MHSTSSSQGNGGNPSQQQQQQHPLQHVEVPVAAHNLRGDHVFENRLVELLLQRPTMITSPRELEEGYVWQEMVMVGAGGRGLWDAVQLPAAQEFPPSAPVYCRSI